MSSQKVVLITGASGGIGEALARAFGEAGYALVLAGRRMSRLEEVASQCAGSALPLVLDVGELASIEAGIAQVIEHYGRLDILVNNAGIAVSAPLRAGEELADAHMRVNFHGPRRLLEHALPHLAESPGAHVVQVASSAGLMGYTYTSAYCASKHALVGYTRAAALELKRKRIAFHTLCPHFVDSPMTSASVERIVETTGQTAQEARATLAAMNPDGEFVTPNAIAKLALDACGVDTCEETSGQIWELTGSQVHVLEAGFSL